MPVVASSRNKTGVGTMSALATCTRRRVPPDNSWPTLSRWGSSSSAPICFSTAARSGAPLRPRNLPHSTRLSRTVSSGSTAVSCSTAASARRAPSGSSLTSQPAIHARPVAGRSSVASIPTVVVFPAPFGPSSPKISPGATVNEIPSTAAAAAER